MSFPTCSFWGDKYVLTFIDDFSRFSWVYFLKYKSDFFATFKTFTAFVEKQSSYSIKKLCTDNGGEYIDKEIIEYCREQDIQHHNFVPYTPEQNGVAERKNMTLKEMENYMIQFKNMAPTFWEEVVNCANYIPNRMPHKELPDITPKEAWNHVNPDVSFFKVFGSLEWALIPGEKWKAMEKKSQPLIFVGYYEDMKAYRLFDPSSKYVLFKRDVIYDEEFTSVSSPSFYSTYNITDHVDSFVYQEDDFVVEHHVSEGENQQEENLPSTPEHLDQGQHDQEQPLRKIHCERQSLDKYGYEPTFKLFCL